MSSKRALARKVRRGFRCDGKWSKLKSRGILNDEGNCLLSLTMKGNTVHGAMMLQMKRSIEAQTLDSADMLAMCSQRIRCSNSVGHGQ